VKLYFCFCSYILTSVKNNIFLNKHGQIQIATDIAIIGQYIEHLFQNPFQWKDQFKTPSQNGAYLFNHPGGYSLPVV
jgi:hypothetical protein